MKVFRYNIDKLNNASAEIIPDSSIQKSGKPFFMPFTNERYECRIAAAVRIGRLGKNIASRFASRYYNEWGLCLATPATEMLERLKAAGEPWAEATAFDGAIIEGIFYDDNLSGKEIVYSGSDGLQRLTMPLNEMFDSLIAQASRHFIFKMGDLVLIDLGDSHLLTLDTKVTATIDNKESINIKIK